MKKVIDEIHLRRFNEILELANKDTRKQSRGTNLIDKEITASVDMKAVAVFYNALQNGDIIPSEPNNTVIYAGMLDFFQKILKKEGVLTNPEDN